MGSSSHKGHRRKERRKSLKMFGHIPFSGKSIKNGCCWELTSQGRHGGRSAEDPRAHLLPARPTADQAWGAMDTSSTPAGSLTCHGCRPRTPCTPGSGLAPSPGPHPGPWPRNTARPWGLRSAEIPGPRAAESGCGPDTSQVQPPRVCKYLPWAGLRWGLQEQGWAQGSL